MSMSIEELDATVRAFYEGRGEQQKQAQATLNQAGDNQSIAKSNTDMIEQFKENPDAWLMVDKILESAAYPQTKCWPSLQCFWKDDD